jgi:isopenicillin N synthase-like dioxygenase
MQSHYTRRLPSVSDRYVHHYPNFCSHVDILIFAGEALEVATEGRLIATPHYVRVGKRTTTAVSRETFALFMAPETDQALSTSETYGQFSKRIINSHYTADVSSAA